MLKMVNWLLVVLHWGNWFLLLVLVEQTAQSLKEAWGVGRFRGGATGGADILVGGRRGSAGTRLCEIVVIGLGGVDRAEIGQAVWLHFSKLFDINYN